jgi:hypothetical protein
MAMPIRPIRPKPNCSIKMLADMGSRVGELVSYASIVKPLERSFVYLAVSNRGSPLKRHEAECKI